MQPPILSEVANDTSQSAVMLCGWEVKADGTYATYELNI